MEKGEDGREDAELHPRLNSGADEEDGIASVENVTRSFEMLTDEVRVSILRSIVEHQVENNAKTISYSELLEKANVEDSGRFNYHLGRLRGKVLEKREEGYGLTPAGMRIAGAILSGSFDVEWDERTLEIDDTCHECSSELIATYEDSILVIKCRNDHPVYQSPIPPGTVIGRDTENALNLATKIIYHELDLSAEGICFLCYGSREKEVIETEFETGSYLAVESKCERCGVIRKLRLFIHVMSTKELRTFYHEHGYNIHDMYPWEHVNYIEDESQISENPERYRVEIGLKGDTIEFILDGETSVVETNHM